MRRKERSPVSRSGCGGMNARRTLVYFHTFSRSYLRNPLGLFFALVFPIILILIFGGVFSSSGSAAVPFYVQNMDHSSPASQQFLSALNKTGVVSITMVDPSAGNLSSYLAKNSYTAGMVIPAGFGLTVRQQDPGLGHRLHEPVRGRVVLDRPGGRSRREQFVQPAGGQRDPDRSRPRTSRSGARSTRTSIT